MPTVAQLITHHADRVCLTASIADTAAVMINAHISSVVIVDNDVVCGIVTEHDILQAMQSKASRSQAISTIMSSPVHTVNANMDFREAYHNAALRGTRHLVVTDAQEKLLGIVTETDFRHHLGHEIFYQLNTLEHLMVRDFPQLPPDVPLSTAIEVMMNSRQSCVIVTENKTPIGIITECDVVRLFVETQGDPQLGQVMTHPVATVSAETPLHLAAQKMLDHGFRHLAVVDTKQKLSGLLTEHILMHPLQVGLLDSALSERIELGLAHAISEQKIARDAQYQRALLDNFPFLVWLKDTESRFLAVNRHFADAADKPSINDILGKTDLDLFPQQLAEKYRTDDAEVMASGVKKTSVEQITTPDGTLWHETYKAPVLDDAGRLLGTVGFARDISAQYRNDHATLIRNAALAGLLRGEPLNSLLELIALSAETEIPELKCAIFLVAENNQHLELAAAPSLSEADRKLIQLMPIAEGSCATGTAAFRRTRVIIDDIFSSSCCESFANFAQQVGFSSAWAEPIFSPAGELLGTFTAYHPETFIPSPTQQELRRLASQLTALIISSYRNAAEIDLSLATFRGIFDSVDDALVITNKCGKILDVNARFTELAEHPRATLVGMNCHQLLMGGVNVPAKIDAYFTATLAGTPQTFEVWGESGSGRLFPVEARLRPTQYFGQAAVIASVQDICERKTTAQRLLVERDLANALASGQSREELFPLLLDIALRFPEFECGGLYISNPDGSYQLVEDRGLSKTFLDAISYLPAESANAELLTAGGIICSCTEGEARCTHPDLLNHPHIQAENITCMAALPIVVAGKTIVSLNLAGRHVEQISHGTYRSLEALASHFAQTLIRVDAQAETRRLQTNLSGLFDALNDLLFIMSPQGKILHYNYAVTEQLGYAAKILVGQPIATVHPPKLAKTVDETIASMLAGSIISYPLPILRADGSELMVETRIVMGYWDGEPAILSISHDITERIVAEQRQRLAASVFDNAREGIMITNPQGRIIDVNETFTELTGYSYAESIGNTADLLKSGHHSPEFYADMWASIHDHGYWQGEIWNRKKTGEMFVEQLTISAVHDEQGAVSHYVGMFSDITLVKEHQKRLEHLAHFDALTKLPNRMLLADRMQLAMAQTERSGTMLAVCYLDLDGFKPVNDQYGHATGDQLLVEVAHRLQLCTRAGDTVSRLGGDEFVILLSNIADEHECDQAVARIIATLSNPTKIASHHITISASIGVTIYPQDAADPDTLLRHADQAMYAAKQAGRNRHHIFDPEHDRRTRIRREENLRIREALQANQFELYYQPKVNMRRGTVVGMEALIRWNHPEQGVLPPSHFMHALESGELSIALGDWVLHQALQQLDTWLSQGLDISVSVNIAGDHLQSAGFVERLCELLGNHPNIPPSHLELEILETAALEDIEQVTEIFDRGRELGVTFSLDDFGTGYSSLTYFRRLPADILKIDQSFVRDMLENKDDLAIIEGIIGLTRAFKRQVIAEGVETTEHGLALLLLGCELVQGYGIARPMPASEITSWIEHFKPSKLWDSAISFGWSKEDLPLLVAEANHERWMLHLFAYLKAPTGSMEPPELNHSKCQFSHWYANQASQRYAHLDGFLEIDSIHSQLHRLAQELIEKHHLEDTSAVVRLSTEVTKAHDHLIANIQAIQSEILATG